MLLRNKLAIKAKLSGAALAHLYCFLEPRRCLLWQTLGAWKLAGVTESVEVKNYFHIMCGKPTGDPLELGLSERPIPLS